MKKKLTERELPKLINSQYGYNFWKGTSEGVNFFNITPIGQCAPSGGYYNSDYISKIKGVPNLFK